MGIRVLWDQSWDVVVVVCNQSTSGFRGSWDGRSAGG